MDTETGEARLPLDLLDKGDAELTLQELSAGIAKLKGTARTFDLLFTQHRIHLTQKRVLDTARPALDNVGSAGGCNEPTGCIPEIIRKMAEVVAATSDAQ